MKKCNGVKYGVSEGGVWILISWLLMKAKWNVIWQYDVKYNVAM